MGIADLFRPKHRHSNPDIRAEAVRQMQEDESELLASIARDDRDPAVRRLAIEKIDDAELLAALSKTESDRGVRARARQRAASLWTSVAASARSDDEAELALAGLIRMEDQAALADIASRAQLASVRETALAKLSDDKALAKLARGATDQQARSVAVERIRDAAVLRALAMDSTRKDAALAALERIDDEATLEQLAAKAKSKAVRTRAKRMLAARVEAEKPAAPQASDEDKRRRAELAQLVRRAESLARGQEWIASAGEMRTIESDWQRLAAAADPATAKRFGKATARYWQRQAAYEQTQQRDDVAPEEPHSPQPEEAQESAEEEPATPAVEDEQARAERERLQAEREQARAERERAQAERQQAQAQLRAEREREAGKNLTRLESLSADMEAMLATPKRAPAEKLLSRSQRALEGLEALPEKSKAAAIERFESVRKQLVIKVRELQDAEDWERWANVPRQEALIKEAEALLNDQEATELGNKLKSLQSRWKDVGPVPRNKSQELWTQFKAHCDGIYERVKLERSKVSEEHQANLDKKVALCERVEVLAESSNWVETAEEIKELQRQWKDVGPVPRRQSEAVWKRFRAACDRFFERRKPHLDAQFAELEENLAKKEALCARAEALAESTTWEETARELRGMQREWKEIGRVPRNKMRGVQKRFRQACDRFFEEREAEKQREVEDRRKALESLRSEMDALLAYADGTEGGATTASAARQVEPGLAPLANEASVAAPEATHPDSSAAEESAGRPGAAANAELASASSAAVVDAPARQVEPGIAAPGDADGTASASTEVMTSELYESETDAGWELPEDSPTEASSVEATEASSVEATEASSAEATEASSAEATEASSAEATEASSVEATEASSAEATHSIATDEPASGAEEVPAVAQDGEATPDDATPDEESAAAAPPASVPPQSADELAKRVLEVRGRVRELELTRSQIGAFQEHLERLYRSAVERAPDSFRGTELDPDVSKKRKQKLLSKAEELAPANRTPAVDPNAPADELAARLRAALAENALGSSLAGVTDGRSMTDVIADLRDAWNQLGPVPGDEGVDLEERFAAACERAAAMG